MCVLCVCARVHNLLLTHLCNQSFMSALPHHVVCGNSASLPGNAHWTEWTRIGGFQADAACSQGGACIRKNPSITFATSAFAWWEAAATLDTHTHTEKTILEINQLEQFSIILHCILLHVAIDCLFVLNLKTQLSAWPKMTQCWCTLAACVLMHSSV